MSRHDLKPFNLNAFNLHMLQLLASLSLFSLLFAPDTAAVRPFYVYEGPAYDWLKNCSGKSGPHLARYHQYQIGGELICVGSLHPPHSLHLLLQG